MEDKLVKRITTGETFIATDWEDEELRQTRLDMWRLDHNQHQPMPSDHKMFQRPQDYGCVFIRFNVHTFRVEEY